MHGEIIFLRIILSSPVSFCISDREVAGIVWSHSHCPDAGLCPSAQLQLALQPHTSNRRLWAASRTLCSSIHQPYVNWDMKIRQFCIDNEGLFFRRLGKAMTFSSLKGCVYVDKCKLPRFTTPQPQDVMCTLLAAQVSLWYRALSPCCSL